MQINTENIFIGRAGKSVKSHPYDWRFFLKTFESLVSKDMTVVEIGCSNFQKTQDLARRCKKLIGIEIDKAKIIEFGGNIEVINGDWQDLSSIVGRSSVDLVVSSHVIEHVPDDLRAINETYEALKSGGSLLFLTPNRNRLTRIAAHMFGFEKKLIYPEHLREYSFNELMHLISMSRFRHYSVQGAVLGLHTGPFLFYLKKSPLILRNFVNFWLVALKK
ncbi:MAG: class I SAM-dependent methyltransferase [Candidatus Omnitrophica bacterium]|nr:class I SAM-dependent methyltransferase [Candidatus Omnitrophota bacterium]